MSKILVLYKFNLHISSCSLSRILNILSMPSFPPRTEPIKKEQQLCHKKRALIFALQKNLPEEKQVKAAEKYKAAQLSFFKAALHVIQEKEFQNKASSISTKSIEDNIAEWTCKPIHQIIKEIRDESINEF